MHQIFDAYVKEEENLSGVLNTKTLSLKNLELKEKINFWRDSIDFRDVANQRINEKQKQITEILTRYIQDVSLEKDKIEVCRKDYFELIEERRISEK